MISNSSSQTVIPEIPQSYMGKLYVFIEQMFLTTQKERFTEITRAPYALSYTVLGPTKNRHLHVTISGDDPITINVLPLAVEVSEGEITKAQEDVTIAVNMFEDRIRKNSLYFAWREGEKVVPEEVSGKENKSLRRIFLETQIILIGSFMALGVVLFFFIGPLVPIILLAVQFVFVFYSNKIIARTADWHINKKNPYIHVLQYPLSPNEENPVEKMSKESIRNLKHDIYQRTIAENGELNCSIAHDIFAQYGINCQNENLIAKKVDVYDIVKTTADKFGYDVPEIVISNTLLPNAAASGPSPRRGVVLITTGTFLQLSNEEIISVLGHEFGHLKGRDPLWLYGLSAIQYLFWFYVIFGLFPPTSFLLLFIYLWGLLTLTYFVAKFFEARADLYSAMIIGQPQVLASALEKIGFQRLLYERIATFRIQEWLSMDAHPPIYFRIARLRKMQEPVKIEHPLAQSAKEVTKGFADSF